MPKADMVIDVAEQQRNNATCCNAPVEALAMEAAQTAETRAQIELQENVTKKQSCAANLATSNSYATNKNVAEGLMDIALLSANANQLRFLITYNHAASTFYISLTLVIVSLIMQIIVGITLIFKRSLKGCPNNGNNSNSKYMRINEFLIACVFMVTVINILLAAFTTTDGAGNN